MCVYIHIYIGLTRRVSRGLGLRVNPLWNFGRWSRKTNPVVESIDGISEILFLRLISTLGYSQS